MDCNRDEAMRARELAEINMLKNDFTAARKLGLKAQKLFPELDNISQLLTVCDVHCSAQRKVSGSEMDWYAILQVEKMADEATIKKQYRKHALLLHPDKNKFAGAEAAFKLIGEANRLLTDRSKRSLYDMKIRAPTVRTAPKPPPHRNTYVRPPPPQHVNPPIVVNSQFRAPQAPVFLQQETFWTCCTSCNMRYEYFKLVINKTLLCQNCSKPFVASASGAQAPSPQVPNFRPGVPIQKELPTQGTSKASPVKHTSSRTTVGKNAEGSSKPKSKTQNDGQGFRGKVDFGVYVSEKKDGVPTNIAESAARQSEIPKSGGKKRKRGKTMLKNTVIDSSESFEDSDSDTSNASVQENGGEQNSGAHNRRTSARNKNKRNVIYFENFSDDDDCVSHSKESSASEEATVKEDAVNKDGTGGFAFSETCSSHEEGGVKDARTFPNKMPGDEDNVGFGTEEAPILNILETQFNDFEKSKEADCFALGQMWALYDTLDGMPRYYALIEKMGRHKFGLQVRWLEPNQSDEFVAGWVKLELPVTCGLFKRGLSGRNIDRPMFSHKVEFEIGRLKNSYLIYPRAGETWALFKDWSENWIMEDNKDRQFTYEIVEVVLDFVQGVGVKAVYLDKIKGFVSLFGRAKQERMDPFTIPCQNLLRFSHRVPSCRMMGTEREGVPRGCFELDTAALPNDLQTVFHEVEMESGKGVDGEGAEAKDF